MTYLWSYWSVDSVGRRVRDVPVGINTWIVVLWRGALSFERGTSTRTTAPLCLAYIPSHQREFFIDNLLVRIRFIIEMIWWTGLAPREFEFPFPGSLISTGLQGLLEIKDTDRPRVLPYAYA